MPGLSKHARSARLVVSLGLVAAVLAGPAAPGSSAASLSPIQALGTVAPTPTHPIVTPSLVRPISPLPLAPPPPVAPVVAVAPVLSPFATVSDGTQLTTDDFSQFDAQWMTQSAHNKAYSDALTGFGYRDTDYAWGISDHMSSMARMYEVTHDRRYLDDLRQFIQLALAYRDDVYPGNLDKAGCPNCDPTPIDEFRGHRYLPAWGGFGSATAGKNTVDPLTSVLYAYPIAEFARIVAEEPALQPTYGADALRYANEVMRTMWVFMPQVQYRQVGSYWEGYITSLDLRESPLGCQSTDPNCKPPKLTVSDCETAASNDHTTDPNRLKGLLNDCKNMVGIAPGPQAHNENGAFMMMAIELWRALDSSFYRQSATQASNAEPTRTLIPVLAARFQRYLVDNLQTRSDSPNGERYWWRYLDDTTINPHTEDTSHGSLDMRYLDLLRRNFDRLNALAAPHGEPIPLDVPQLRRYANAFLEKINVGTDFAHDIDSKPEDPGRQVGTNQQCDGWLNLSVVDANIYSVCREMSLRVVGGVQPYLTIANHSTLLMNKGFSKPVVNQDLTGVSGTITAAGDPFGYVFDAQGAQSIVYRATDGHVHGLWRQGSSIGNDDLSWYGGAPGAAGDPKAYVFPAQGIQNVVYRGTDSHLHGLYWSTGAVGHDDLTWASNAPEPAGNAFGYLIGATGFQNVVYRGVDGHLHGLYWSTGAVGHDDLTALSRAPAPAGDPFGYAVNTQGLQSVVYRGVDGHLHGLYWSTGAVG